MPNVTQNDTTDQIRNKKRRPVQLGAPNPTGAQQRQGKSDEVNDQYADQGENDGQYKGIDKINRGKYRFVVGQADYLLKPDAVPIRKGVKDADEEWIDDSDHKG